MHLFPIFFSSELLLKLVEKTKQLYVFTNFNKMSFYN